MDIVAQILTHGIAALVGASLVYMWGGFLNIKEARKLKMRHPLKPPTFRASDLAEAQKAFENIDVPTVDPGVWIKENPMPDDLKDELNALIDRVALRTLFAGGGISRDMTGEPPRRCSQILTYEGHSYIV